MVEPVAVFVQLFAMIRRDHQQRVFGQAQFVQLRQDVGEAGVHVGDAGIVLRFGKLDVGDARHPLGKVAVEVLELPDRVHAAVAGSFSSPA